MGSVIEPKWDELRPVGKPTNITSRGPAAVANNTVGQKVDVYDPAPEAPKWDELTPAAEKKPITIFTPAVEAVKEMAASFKKDMVGGLGQLTTFLAESYGTKDPNHKPAEWLPESYKQYLIESNATDHATRKVLAEKGTAWAAEWEKKSTEGPMAPRTDITWDNPITKTFKVVGAALPMYATALLSSFVTKSPTPAMAIFGGQQAASTYTEARSKGVSIDKAALYAKLDGAWTGLSEAIPFDSLLGAPGKKLLISVAKNATIEGFQELIQTVGSNSIAKFGYDKGRKLFEGWVESVVGGLVLGGAGGAFMSKTKAPEATTPPIDGVPPLKVSGLTPQQQQDMGINQDEAMSRLKALQQETDKIPVVLSPEHAAELGIKVGEPNGQEKVQAEKVASDTQAQGPSSPPAVAPEASKTTLAAAVETPTEETLTQLWKDETLTEAEKLAAMPEEKAARITKIDSEIKAINKQIEADVRTAAERYDAGKPIVQATNRYKDLYQQLDALNTEKLDLQTNPEAVVGKKHGEVRADQLRSLITKNVQGKIKAMAQGIRKGVVQAKGSIKSIQAEVESLIQQSDIPKARKSQIMKVVKNIQTEQQLYRRAPELIARLSALEEDFKTRSIRKDIEKQLGDFAPRTKNGIPQGKDADAQHVIDQINEYKDLTKDQVDYRLENPLPEDNPVLLEIAGDYKNMGSEELQRLGEVIAETIRDGKSKLAAKLEAKKIEMDTIVADATASMFGEGDTEQVLKDTAKAVLGFRKSFDVFMAKSFRRFSVWDALMDALSHADPKHALTKIFDMNKTLEKWKSNFNAQQERAYSFILEAGGFKDLKQVFKYMNEGSKEETIGQHTTQTIDKDGAVDTQTETMNLSRNQVIYNYGKMQEPGMRENLKKTMGWTFKEDVLPGEVSTEELFENFLGKQGMDIANAILDFYESYGKETNPFYRDKYGVDMKYIQRYSPQAREGDLAETDILNPPGKSKRMFTPSAFKERTSSSQGIVEQDAFSALTKHIGTIEHFKALSGQMEKLDAVFNNAKIIKAITRVYGKGILDNIKAIKESYATGHIPAIEEANRWFEKARVNLIKAKLAAKGTISAKQVVQSFGYMMHPEVSARGWIREMAYTLAHIPEAIKFITSTETYKNRGASMERDIQIALNSSKYKLVQGMNNVNDMLVKFALFGDKISVVLGGYAAYREVLHRTGSKEKALEVFSKATNETQQSANLDQQTAFGSHNGFWGRLSSTFMTGQNQVANMMLRAGKDYYANPTVENAKQFSKALIVGHLIIPMLMQYMTNGFEWDTGDEIKAAMLGGLSGIFVFSDIAEALVAFGYNATHRDEKPKELFKAGNLIYSAIENISKTSSKLLKDGGPSGMEIYKAVAAFVEPLSGIPAVTLGNMAQGVGNLMDGNTAYGIKELLGYSPYIAEGKNSGGDSSGPRFTY